MTSSHDDYVPGVCNIGRQETKLRHALGWIAAAVGLVLLIMLTALKAAAMWRLALFFPTFVSALGFLQARRGFCVKYGLAGAFNFGDIIGRATNVTVIDDRRQDRHTSLLILAQAVAIATLVAVAAYGLP